MEKPNSMMNLNIKEKCPENIVMPQKERFCFVLFCFITTSLPFYLSGIMSDHQFGNQFMCSVVASHVSHLPTTNLSFVWIAPPAGTGCVNFM